MKKSNFLKWILITVGGILMVFLSLIIYGLLIPDICYYHTHDMNSVMRLFYGAGGGDNGHPFPTIFNFIVSLLIGGFLGYKFYKIVMKKRNELTLKP